ncbi:MAG: alpha/beta fold hydrolase [Acidimicrobiales bacterium]
MQIHHTQQGEGDPLILLHGWGSDSKSNWVDTGWVAALTPYRRVVTIDCRGHGRSEKPHVQGAYSYVAMCEDVLDVMDELGIARTDLVGYSMGAFIAVALLGRHCDRLSSVVMGGIGEETAESAAACAVIAAALRADDPDLIDDPLGRAYRAFVGRRPGNDLEALALAALQMWPEGFPLEVGGAGLRDVDIPVLIVNGSEDHPYVDSAGELAAAIPRSKLVVIPGTDHLSTVTDDRFKTEVIAFLTGHS